MPYTNTWESDGLYRKFTGELFGDEILDSNIELHRNPNFQHIKYVINDFTEITGHSIGSNHTKVYASTDDMISTTKGRLKIAIVVPQTSLIALANNYREQIKNKIFECDVFQTIEDARKWVEN